MMNLIKKSIAIATISILSIAGSQAMAAGNITTQQAAAIAKKHAGGVVTDVDYERSRRGDYYEVEVKKPNGEEWHIHINAKTGKIIHTRVEYDD